jgi:hypothetical protein
MRTETLIGVSRILAKLRQERERIDESIVSLERRAGRRRGRPLAKRSVPGSAGVGSGSSGAPLPSYPLPRRTPRNPDLKNRAWSAARR